MKAEVEKRKDLVPFEALRKKRTDLKDTTIESVSRLFNIDTFPHSAISVLQTSSSVFAHHVASGAESNGKLRKKKTKRDRRRPPEISSKKKNWKIKHEELAILSTSLKNLQRKLSSVKNPLCTKILENSRDPRFSGLSGKLDLNKFGKSYAFVNDIRQREKAALRYAQSSQKLISQKRNRRRNDLVVDSRNFGTNEYAAKKEMTKSLLRKLEVQDALRKKKTEQASLSRTIRNEEIRQVLCGKKRMPFFPKMAVIKKLANSKIKTDFNLKIGRSKSIQHSKKFLPSRRGST